MFFTIRKYIASFRHYVWFLEGAERQSDAELRMLYIGNFLNKNYIAKLAFKPPFREKFLGRFWLLNPTSFRHKLSKKCDITITDVKKVPVNGVKKPWLFIPYWIAGKINIDEVLMLAETRKKLKKDLKRIRKHQYTYEVVRGKDFFDDFYHHMYVPHIKNTFGNEARPHSLETILKGHENSDLLLVKDGQLSVAGEIYSYDTNGPKVLCLGILNGDHRYVKEGAICALYYFRLIYLKSKGYADIDLGLSRVFLSDGVLRFKKKWGMKMTSASDDGFLIHQLTLKDGTKSFLKNNPFIMHELDGFSCVCFFDENDNAAEKEKNNIIDSLALTGVKKLLCCELEGALPIKTISDNIPVSFEAINDMKNNCAVSS